MPGEDDNQGQAGADKALDESVNIGASVTAKRDVEPPDLIDFKSPGEMREFISSNTQRVEDRMVVKGSVVNDARAAQPAEEEEEEEDSSDTAEGKWGPRASVAKQMLRYPGSVREKAAVTSQFILADKDQLAAWNKIQDGLHPPDAPTLKLVDYDRSFSPALSSYVVMASVAELEYQQL